MSIIRKNEKDRVMVFMDLCNVKIPFENKEFRHTRLDYECLVNELVGNRDLVAAYVFDTEFPDGSNVRLKEELSRSGFRMIERPYDENLTEQKEVDVALAGRMIVNAARDLYDVAILISGDRDFCPAIEFVQEYGKVVEVAAFSDSSSYRIVNAADLFTELDSVPMARFVEDEAYGDAGFIEMEDYITNSGNVKGEC
ncbi:MAG: NYN domain-containing protein [Candidatus Methanomethylophilaceae archaeon]